VATAQLREPFDASDLTNCWSRSACSGSIRRWSRARAATGRLLRSADRIWSGWS